MVSSFRVGIDFHGVITENPTFFRCFSALLFAQGHSVYIVSGGPYSVEKAYLDLWGVRYTEIFSLLDFFARRGQVEYFANGNFKVPDCLWDERKGIYCRDNNISVHIDDTIQYRKNFTTPFCWYNPKDGIGKIDNEKIDFNRSPENVLQNLETILKS